MYQHCQRTPIPKTPIASRRRRASAALAVAAVSMFAVAAVGGASPASAADPTIGLGSATPFAVLAGSTVTNTGPSVISGDLGLSPGSSVTGFPPGVVIHGSHHVADALAVRAKRDLTTAYNDAAHRPTAANVTGKDLGGMTLTPGVYEASTAMALTGTLTLNARGNSSAVFIFKAGSTLVTATHSAVRFSNGGSACNVFWQVGSSATLHPATQFIGTIMANASATIETGATIHGRVLARTGAVTLDTNRITAPNCSTAPVKTNPTGGSPTSGPTRGATPHTTTHTDTTSKPSPTTPARLPRFPVIPKKHPATGEGGSQHSSPADTALSILAGLTCAGAAVLAGLGSRTEKRRGSNQ